MPREFRDPPGFSLQKPGKTCTRGNAEFLKFNYASLVSFFSLSLFLPPLSVYVRLTKKGEKKLFRLFRRKFSTKYFSRHGGCLASPVARKGFEKETGRRPVQVHPTDLNSYFSNHANVEIRILGGCLESFFSPGSRLIFLLSIFD